jgi:hypothetical protein
MISFFFKSVDDVLWLPLGTGALGLLKGMKVMIGDSSPLGRTIGRGEFCFADGAMGLGEDRRSGIALMVKASAMLWNGSYLFEGGVGGAGGFSKTRCCMLFRTVAVGEAIVDLLYSTAPSMGEAYGFVAYFLMICELGNCSRLSSFDRYDGKKRPTGRSRADRCKWGCCSKETRKVLVVFQHRPATITYRCRLEYESAVASLFLVKKVASSNGRTPNSCWTYAAKEFSNRPVGRTLIAR